MNSSAIFESGHFNFFGIVVVVAEGFCLFKEVTNEDFLPLFKNLLLQCRRRWLTSHVTEGLWERRVRSRSTCLFTLQTKQTKNPKER